MTALVLVRRVRHALEHVAVLQAVGATPHTTRRHAHRCRTNGLGDHLQTVRSLNLSMEWIN